MANTCYESCAMMEMEIIRHISVKFSRKKESATDPDAMVFEMGNMTSGGIIGSLMQILKVPYEEVLSISTKIENECTDPCKILLSKNIYKLLYMFNTCYFQYFKWIKWQTRRNSSVTSGFRFMNV